MDSHRMHMKIWSLRQRGRRLVVGVIRLLSMAIGCERVDLYFKPSTEAEKLKWHHRNMAHLRRLGLL